MKSISNYKYNIIMYKYMQPKHKIPSEKTSNQKPEMQGKLPNLQRLKLEG